MENSEFSERFIRILDRLASITDPSLALKYLEETDIRGLNDFELAELALQKGKRLWKSGEKALAISQYETAANLNPDSPAALLLEHSRSIMDFFNPDLLNP